jgi:hypothetical protein
MLPTVTDGQLTRVANFPGFTVFCVTVSIFSFAATQARVWVKDEWALFYTKRE